MQWNKATSDEAEIASGLDLIITLTGLGMRRDTDPEPITAHERPLHARRAAPGQEYVPGG